MSGDDKNNPYAAPKADIASSPLLVNGPGAPVKAVLIGVLACIAMQIVAGLILFALGGVEMRDGEAQVPQALYAFGVLLSIPINVWAGAKTARIANVGEYRWAALAEPYRRFLDPADGSLRIQIRLVRESGPFVLDPHLDMEQKRLVVVVYLADEDAPESLGTTLYTRNGDRFVAVTTTPYRANCASTMLRTPDAWHGGEWRDLVGERNTMHLYFHRST